MVQVAPSVPLLWNRIWALQLLPLGLVWISQVPPPCLATLTGAWNTQPGEQVPPNAFW